MINQSRYNNIEATIIFLATNNNNNDLYTDRISIYPKKNTRQLLKFYIYIIFFSIIRQLYRFESCERNVGHVTCAFDRQPFRYYDKEKFFVQCIANIKENELVYLSNLLNPVECLQLVQAIYEVTPMKTERRVKKYETLMNKDFAGMSTLSKECLLNLEEWSQDFPTNARPSGRTTMEMILRWLGRPDLANNKNHHDLKKKDNRHSRQPNNSTNKYIAHTSMYCSILLILFFITICLVAAYYFYKRNSTKARGTRFKHMRRPKEDKDTVTDLEWKDEIICSCTDMEECCTGECSLCKESDYKQHMIDRRSSSSDESIKELNFVARNKPKKKEKKRKRFAFFQNSCQNKKKEKEQEKEYRDRKKILENMMNMKKHEKLYPMVPNNVCCKCCKCSVYIRDKILREKKAKEKKARKKKEKEEKKRKKEKLRKAEVRPNNVCFRDTCK
ncbi:uncharacterized protein LOC113219394 isoform X3 [Apis mellifera]|uniref:Uncharacterized protein LOC113219394 isoform X3 n=1 Tax=Apis mellifera TaxID=7460 RepID=A0A7M7MX62_APIME|nr:uncharacterized protein LOC113219394 isoform X3 [Apis mellifera]|eukprot:XP_026301824.1 uncharacterized protein LOC113219394 isoform X3 [Apis mellifera]